MFYYHVPGLLITGTCSITPGGVVGGEVDPGHAHTCFTFASLHNSILCDMLFVIALLSKTYK